MTKDAWGHLGRFMCSDHKEFPVIHFNAGLHDLKYLLNGKKDAVKGTQMISIGDYKNNLHSIIRYLQEMTPDARLVFATTTRR